MKHIFEVIDTTDRCDEQCVGTYATKREAMAVLKSNTPPHPKCYQFETVEMEVRRYGLGLHMGSHQRIASREWVSRPSIDGTKIWIPEAII